MRSHFHIYYIYRVIGVALILLSCISFIPKRGRKKESFAPMPEINTRQERKQGLLIISNDYY